MVLGLLFHVDDKVVVLVHMDLEVFLGETRSGQLHVVLFLVFNYIDGRSGVVRPFHPAVVEEVVEDVNHFKHSSVSGPYVAFRPGSSSERLRILQSWDQCRDDGLFVTIEVPNSPFCGQIVQVGDGWKK